MRRSVLVQLVLATALGFSFIWGWRQAFYGSAALLVGLLIAILVWSHRQRGDQVRDLGFRLDTAPRAALLLAPVVVLVIASALILGSSFGSLRFPPTALAAGALAKLILFGLAQQYVLLGFYYRGVLILVRRPLPAMLIASLVFAAFHLPNPFLTSVTLCTGLVAIFVYRRATNLWVNGVAHGITSFVLFYALPADITGGLRVGSSFI